MPARRLQIIWEGDFAGAGSIAHVNRELARRVRGRVDLSLMPNDGRPADPDLDPLVGRRLSRVDIVMRHSTAPIALAPRQGRWVWMQPWEYGPSLPSAWFDAMQRETAVVCANSAWTGRMFVENGLVPERVAVTQNGVDTARFHPSASPMRLATDKRFRFLFVGRLTHRKGLEHVLTAFRHTFTASDDVVFVIKPCDTDGVSIAAIMRDIGKAFADPAAPALVILPTDMASDAIAGLYTACDVLVHPYRGESFCLPIAEAMACGLPVIATDRGGASMMARPDTATLVPSTVVHLPRFAFGHRRLSNLPRWHEISLDRLRTEMRAIYADPTSARAKAVQARQLIAAQFTWDHSAAALLQAFETAMDPHLPRGPVMAPLPQRERWLEEADRHLANGEVDDAGCAYHRCLGRHALLADRADGHAIAAAALVGLGRIARERRQSGYALRFWRLASKLYSSRRLVGSATA
jgi:glycosyltransferase involved in cell wall biosynthesis